MIKLRRASEQQAHNTTSFSVVLGRFKISVLNSPICHPKNKISKYPKWQFDKIRKIEISKSPNLQNGDLEIWQFENIKKFMKTEQ